MDQPTPPVNIVATSREGGIVELSEGAATLLNVTMRGLERAPRTLVMFFEGAQIAVLTAQRDARPEPGPPLYGAVRPRDGAPQAVSVSVRELSNGFLEWTIRPA